MCQMYDVRDAENGATHLFANMMLNYSWYESFRIIIYYIQKAVEIQELI